MPISWDYTKHAAYYAARPSYVDAVVDALVAHTGARTGMGYLVADIGAGTGNLTRMLLARGLRCVAVEPNPEMRQRGIENTLAWAVEWREGTGEETGLASATVDWCTMGSSFNTMDRPWALREVSRILKPGGYFTCLWNHRDLEDSIQQEIERLIRRLVPAYSGGPRRQDQTEIIRGSGLFGEIVFHEASQGLTQTAEAYLDAWRSTANLRIHAGDQFEAVIAAIEKRVDGLDDLRIRYTTRGWTSRKPRI